MENTTIGYKILRIMENTTIGYKMLRADLRSLNKRFQYTLNGWQKVPGNGSYVAVTDGLKAGGIGSRLFQVEGADEVGIDIVSTPRGVRCFRRVRLVKELRSFRLGDTEVKLYLRRGIHYALRREWYEHGQLLCLEHYRSGVPHGWLEYWHGSGELYRRSHYVNGVREN